MRIMKILNFFVIFTLSIFLIGCKNDPGPLSGTWQMSGVMPMEIKFRPGETEAMGIIEKVSYKVSGNDVLVTYEDGMAKGTTIRYTITSSSTAKTAMGTLQKIQ